MRRLAKRSLWVLPLLAGSVFAGDGLSIVDEADVWPRLQTRFQLQASHPGLGAVAAISSSMRLSLLGDYYPSTLWRAPKSAWQGGLRATGGLLAGRAGGLRLPRAVSAGTPGSVTRHALGDDHAASMDSVPTAVGVWPYIGIGYSGLSRRSGWGVVADLGLVAEVPRLGRSAAVGHGLDDAVREIRLSPMVQFSVRYDF